MTKITDFLSPLSFLFNTIGCAPLLLIFFQPNFLEFIVFLVADNLSLLVFKKIDLKLFPFLYPQYKNIFPEINIKTLENCTEKQKFTFFEHLKKFPAYRAFYFILYSFIKVAPPSIVIIFFWEHGLSHTEAVMKLLFIFMFTFNFAAGLAYLENHAFVSQLISKLHEVINLETVFKRSQHQTNIVWFFVFEAITFISIWIFIILLQISIISSENTSLSSQIIQSILVNLVGFIFILKLSFTSRSQLFHGLQNIINHYLSTAEQELSSKTVALSTLPVLSHFQSTLNRLIHKIRHTETQLSGWILHLAEKKRFDELGKLTGLVIHDLSSPLHTIKFCSEELTSGKINSPEKYYDRIHVSVNNAWEIIQHLRHSFRNPDNNPHEASLEMAHDAAIQVTRSSYAPQDIAHISFSCQIDESHKVAIPQPALNQVINNLYSNAIKSMLKAQPTPGKISVSLQKDSGNFYHFLIADHGSGLSSQEFENLTADFEEIGLKYKDSPRAGMGMRLIRGLVEQYGGFLRVAPPHTIPDHPQGTIFELALRKAYG